MVYDQVPDALVHRTEELLASPEGERRLEAVKAAVNIRDIGIIPALVQAASDSDRELSGHATNSLAGLSMTAAALLVEEDQLLPILQRSLFGVVPEDDPFMLGARSVGHDVEKIHLTDKQIGDCSGCGACFSRAGQCCVQDDMGEIADKRVAA